MGLLEGNLRVFFRSFNVKKLNLYPHQEKALGELSSGKILCGGVGTGKTRMALAYALTKQKGKDVYVITTAKKRDDLDWEQEALQCGIIDTPRIKVDSWNNIRKYQRVTGSFFVFDEQRLVGSGAWVKAFLKIARANDWILLSATPGDVWSDYIPVFVANGFYRNKTDFLAQHAVYSRFSKYPKIERYIGEGKLIGLRRKLLVEMPYERATVRNRIYMNVPYNVREYDQLRKTRFDVENGRPFKNVSALLAALRKVVNSDRSRLEKVRKVLEKHPRLIVYYNFDYELEILRELAGDGFVVAEWNGHKHEAVPDGDRWVFLVQYAAGAEAWNCVTTNAMLFYSLNYSYRVMQQSEGRIDRLNTPYVDLYYYILASGSSIDQGILKALARKKTFNERSFMESGKM